MTLTTQLITEKRQALSFFADYLLQSQAKEYVGKIFLFGSLAKGRVKAESDVDVLIVCLNNLKAVTEVCLDAQMETYYRFSESVEPLISPIEVLVNPDSYFLYRAIKYGEEVYSMDEKKLKLEEAKNYLLLADDYLQGARESLKSNRPRIAIDTGYNAAELCAKALLLLELDEIPSSHGGVVGEFSKFYIKTEKLPKEIGRGMNKALDLTNKARYVYNAEITHHDAQEVLLLAGRILEAGRDKLE